MRLLLLLALLSGFSDAYKILIYNVKFAHSHSKYLGRMADILTEAGHNVTSLIPIIDEELEDGPKSSPVIRLGPDADAKAVNDFQQQLMTHIFSASMFNPLGSVFGGAIMSFMFGYNCRAVLNEPGLLERLKEERYDVYITENFDLCGMGISHAIAPKAVIASTTTLLYGIQSDDFGAESAMSYNPTPFMNKINVHSFIDRAWNVYGEWANEIFFHIGRYGVQYQLWKRFGWNYPSLKEQSSRVAYVFTNAEPLIDFAVPTLSRVINIPGLSAQQPKNLSKEWDEILNRRARTVLISFGSIAKSEMLPEDIKQSIIKTISRFPDVTFIWKYENLSDDFASNVASKLDNLVLSKWTPQVDLLNHEKLAVFLTHGGMGSTQEAALRGVPGLFVPVFSEQSRNSAMMEHNGVGKVIDKFDLSNDELLTSSLRELLDNESYRVNAKKLSAMLAKKPFSSNEQLIKYVEFAAEFGPSSALRPQSHDMNFIQYRNLDIIFVAILLTLSVIYLVVKLNLYLLCKIFGLRKQKKD